MTIITYEIDSSHEGIRKRLEQKNTKWDLADALSTIRDNCFDESKSDAQKVKEIKELILYRIWN